MRKYKHLSAKERELMSVLHAKLTSISQIAKELGRSKSTISRELNRDTILYVQNWINSRPMKVLNYKTPSEMYLLSTVPLAC